MIDFPNRNDDMYKDIEHFEDYEFTNCIAFEMAIRNKEVFNIVMKYNEDEIELVNEDTLEYYGIGDYVIDNILAYIENYQLLNCVKEQKKEQYNELKSLIFDHKLKANILINYQIIDCAKVYYGKLGRYRDRSYSHDGKWIIDAVIQNDKGNNVGLNLNLPLLRRDEDRCLDKHFLEYLGSDTIYSAIRRPILDLNRPTLKFKSIPKIDPEINLALPRDELQAYILKIKDEYDNDNSIVKNPLELLGEIFEMSENKHIQKKRNGKKYADWFYIYDYYQILKTTTKKSNETIYNEIDLTLLEYYNSTNNNYYSIETYKKTIMKGMNYLIDELGYKELLTGISNTH